MSERYWITGVQLGTIKAFIENGTDENKAFAFGTLNKVEDDQFIGQMQEPYYNYEIIIKAKERSH